MRLEGRIYRPPGEAWSLLLQLTIGCSHNRCSFCAMYSEKKFRVRPIEDVFADIDEAAQMYPETRRIFICDGDALSAGYDKFLAVCKRINERFPRLGRIAAYVNARDILELSHDQLRQLRSMRFSLAYLGLESGSDRVLDMINKGASSEDMVNMIKHAEACGIKISVIALLGIGGRSLSAEHAAETTRVLNEMQPKRLSFLNTIILPKTALNIQTQNGKFKPLTDREIVKELRTIIAELDLKSTVFRANHTSNLIALEGRMPRDKQSMLEQIDKALPLAQDEVTCVWTAEEGQFL